MSSILFLCWQHMPLLHVLCITVSLLKYAVIYMQLEAKTVKLDIARAIMFRIYQYTFTYFLRSWIFLKIETYYFAKLKFCKRLTSWCHCRWYSKVALSDNELLQKTRLHINKNKINIDQSPKVMLMKPTTSCLRNDIALDIVLLFRRFLKRFWARSCCEREVKLLWARGWPRRLRGCQGCSPGRVVTLLNFQIFR